MLPQSHEDFLLKDRKQWRAWLAQHGKTAGKIWLVYHKKGSAKSSISYDNAVEEALCFGWIDGKIQKIDEQRYAQRFTPRKPGSRWSESNIARVNQLIAEGKITPAGLAVFDPARKSEPHPTELPPNIAKEFRRHAKAWENFNVFPPGYRRMTTGWVASAKKEETQLKRLRQLIKSSAEKKKITYM